MSNFERQTVWTSDNLDVMRGMNSASVDLIYLDPPFNSNHNYAAPIGSEAAGEEFKDTWGLNDVNPAWRGLIKHERPGLYNMLIAVKDIQGDSMTSYLIYMAPRIMEMKRLLKATGSIYLHCDPTASRYLKLVMDCVFGKKNFRNEIAWHYGKWSNAVNGFQKNHDVILFYSKGEQVIFNPVMAPRQAPKAYGTNAANGRKQLLIYDPHDTPEGVRDEYKARGYAEALIEAKGVAEHDVWTYARDKKLNILNSQSKERVGYPTQKPLMLLRRIIEASSNEGDMVLDPFCGCATACIAAELPPHRQWVGIDVSPKAAELVQSRMLDSLGMFFRGPHRTDIPVRTDQGGIGPYNSQHNKDWLYGQQHGYCNGCKAHFEIRNMEIDHIMPRKKGGTDHISNLQLLCGSCNRVKGTKTQEELLACLVDKGWAWREKGQADALRGVDQSGGAK